MTGTRGLTTPGSAARAFAGRLEPAGVDPASPLGIQPLTYETVLPIELQAIFELLQVGH